VRALAALVLLLTVLVASGCEQRVSRGAAEPLLVLAASDLQAAFVEIAERFETDEGIPLRLVFGSTGNLTAQIEHGAPGDVFFAANESFIHRLERTSQLVDGTRRVYALGQLALVWRTGAPEPDGSAALARPDYGTVAIANPEHAPYGTAAREALTAAGIWTEVAPRLVLGENVAQALQFVTTGNADAGIVALGLVVGPNHRPHRLVPGEMHAPLRQGAAVLGVSTRTEEALRLLDFVSGPPGQEILSRFGFLPPDR
jgi:molybdate transport system substrate-binding protein